MSEAAYLLERAVADADAITAVFNRAFGKTENTQIIGGADEPFYQPAQCEDEIHRLFFRADYARSALHEAAHWCIAGQQRRLLPDFGYWYEADGRSAKQQQLFESVEIKPQALEWFFCVAAGLRFRVSVDNLDGQATDSFPFQLAVWQQVRAYIYRGLPRRAARLRQALAEQFDGPNSLRARDYSLRGLCQ